MQQQNDKLRQLYNKIYEKKLDDKCYYSVWIYVVITQIEEHILILTYRVPYM